MAGAAYISAVSSERFKTVARFVNHIVDASKWQYFLIINAAMENQIFTEAILQNFPIHSGTNMLNRIQYINIIFF